MVKKRILVVDDQDTWLKAIQVILGDQYELSLTDDPEEAIALSRASFYSLATSISGSRLTSRGSTSSNGCAASSRISDASSSRASRSSTTP